MAAIDAMPARWRELVHEYGFVPVWGHYEQGDEPDAAEMTLFMMRERRQLDYDRPVMKGQIRRPQLRGFGWL
jgi:hypothetical protein